MTLVATPSPASSNDINNKGRHKPPQSQPHPVMITKTVALQPQYQADLQHSGTLDMFKAHYVNKYLGHHVFEIALQTRLLPLI